MGTRDNVKNWIDTYFPWLPTNRRTSKDVNDLMTSINGAYCDQLDAINTTITALTTTVSSKAAASDLTTIQGTITTLSAKLAGIQTGATANDTDANLKNRANHTGTQPASTITGLATVATSGNYNDLSNKPSFTTRAQASVTRPINGTTFQVSATQDALVLYNIKIGTSLSLSGGTVGDVFLEISTNSGFTTPITLANMNNGNTGALTVGLALSQTNAGQVIGYIPAGYYVRIRTVNTTGTPTFTYQYGQEVLL
jgi:hypothetical protein